MKFRDYNPNSTVEVFAIAWNEEFMLPHFVKHYKDHFDASITIYDNKSTDNTVNLARSLGCMVKVYDTSDQIRDDVYLQIKNNAWRESDADFVIVCDIDEFLEVPFNCDKYTIINTKGYDVIGGVNSRLGVYNSMFCKHIMFKPRFIREINYAPGCHSCRPVGKISGSKEIATLLHRKYISEEYVLKKHIAYKERLSAFNKQYGFGVEYEQSSEEWVKKKFEELLSKAETI